MLLIPLLEALWIITAYGTFFTVLDNVLTNWGFRKPYYAVHVVHNAIMVSITAGDVWTSMTDFENAPFQPLNWHAIFLCCALHFYHTYEYWRTFHPDDWLHHITMIAVALPVGSLLQSGALMGMNLFFTTGLPGGISYALLFAERNGWITRATEKSINRPVHDWIRAPGCIAHATLTAAAIWSATGQSVWAQLGGTLVAALTAWNGIYFANQVRNAALTNRPEGDRADAHNRGQGQ